MNKIYRIVFNTLTGRWVVASEMANGRTKGVSARIASAALLATAGIGLAHAGTPGTVTDSAGKTVIATSTTGTECTGVDAPTADTGASGSAIAEGCKAKATATNAIAIGESATVGAANGVALGANSSVTAGNAVALGAGSIANRANAVSVGAVGSERQIINVAAGTAGTDAVNVSQLNNATRYFKAKGLNDGTDDAVNNGALAIGANSRSATVNDIAIGPGAVANSVGGGNPANSAMAIGYNAQATNYGAMAFGVGAQATGTSGLAFGRYAAAQGASSLALGNRNTAQATNSVSLGSYSLADRDNTVSVGAATSFTDVGGNPRSPMTRQIVNVGKGTQDNDAVNVSQLKGLTAALGGGSAVNADGSIAAPTYTVTNADGTTSQVTGVEAAVTNLDGRVAQNTTAIAGNTTAINNLTTQINNGGVGLVKQDTATRQITVANDSDGTSVNVAGTAGDRVVTGVASGKADNDAVNLGQLKAAGVVGANGESKSVVTYDDASRTSMTMGGEGASSAVAIHNVADGVADHDAVNVSQLNTRLQQNTTEVLVQANGYTDQKIGDVWTGMDKLATELSRQDSRISQQGAMSMAEAQMASGAAAAAVGNPNGAWSVGLGAEQGHGAVSAGYAKPVGAKSQISFGAAFSGGDHSVGVGFAHRL